MDNEEYKEIVFLLNRNKYILTWSSDNPKELQEALLKFFLDYIKAQWGTTEIFVRVVFSKRILG